MVRSHKIIINGKSFQGRRGDLLLDSALANGIDLPYDCRAGHCGACCVRLVEGQVAGGEGTEPGVIHACQGRVIADAVIEPLERSSMRTVQGRVSSLRRVSQEVVEVGIRTDTAFPYLAGQYAQIQFRGYPSRPYSLSHPLKGGHEGRTVWFHIRRMDGGRVSSALGQRIAPGHRVTLTGPYGAAYFRPELDNRLILISTGTGFAPIWSIAAAALHENPKRNIVIIAGGRTIETLYMAPVLVRLARFPNVRVVPFCSKPQSVSRTVMQGRPTDFIPRLNDKDIIYACGLPAMVDTVKEIAARSGAVCYADPFQPAQKNSEPASNGSALSRALSWLAPPATTTRQPVAITSRRKRQPAPERSRRQRGPATARPYGAV